MPQKWGYWLLLGLLISGLGVLPLHALGPKALRAEASGERLVLAFYYAWYDMATWEKPLPDRPTQPYASTDPAAIERHVLWARQAGIDALVQSWYGPWTASNQTETNFVLLLDIAARHGLSAAVDLEVTSPFIHSTGDVIAALRHVRTVHAAHPAYLRVGGRPVIFFWRQQQYSVETWQAIRQEVDPNRETVWIAEGTNLDDLQVFDGNHLYSVAWDPAPEGVLVRWGRRVRDWGQKNGRAPIWVATVMPGYDDRATGRADAFVRDRAGGEYYRRCWQGAAESGADWVIITSFNEWLEGTQIEPSAGYGEFYLNLTRELAEAYRAGRTSAPIAVPTTAPTPSRTPAPPVPSPTPSPLPPTPTATPSPPPTPSPSPTPTAPPTSTVTPTPTPTPTPSPTPTPLPTPTPSAAVPVPLGSAAAFLRANPGLVAAALAALLALVKMIQNGRRR
jgi:hypothetical protein